jgi:hypothetical protein
MHKCRLYSQRSSENGGNLFVASSPGLTLEFELKWAGRRLMRTFYAPKSAFDVCGAHIEFFSQLLPQAIVQIKIFSFIQLSGSTPNNKVFRPCSNPFPSLSRKWPSKYVIPRS